MSAIIPEKNLGGFARLRLSQAGGWRVQVIVILIYFAKKFGQAGDLVNILRSLRLIIACFVCGSVLLFERATVEIFAFFDDIVFD